jgi:hypothetical protein
MKKPVMRQSIKQSTDIVHDAAILLQQVGVIEIDERALDIAIHQSINVQDLINHAAGLFFNRNRQGLITLNQLLATVQQVAA